MLECARECVSVNVMVVCQCVICERVQGCECGKVCVCELCVHSVVCSGVPMLGGVPMIIHVTENTPP